ncbi:MAG: response regulator [Endomicrobia bacterium]|nr:response regulator [Endomicrobiia bacterium]MCL2506941.1 response regulator [Endomicrobiia bacterium]
MTKAKKVLIVEDDIFMRRFLTRFGVENDVAKDGETALELLKDNSYDCVFLDLNLGTGISGFEVLKNIKSDKPKTAVIIISGSDAKDETISMGADYFLAKPIDLIELKQVVEHYL